MPAHRPKDNSYDAYEYTAHSHTYNSFDIPSAKVNRSAVALFCKLIEQLCSRTSANASAALSRVKGGSAGFIMGCCQVCPDSWDGESCHAQNRTTEQNYRTWG